MWWDGRESAGRGAGWNRLPTPRAESSSITCALPPRSGGREGTGGSSDPPDRNVRGSREGRTAQLARREDAKELVDLGGSRGPSHSGQDHRIWRAWHISSRIMPFAMGREKGYHATGAAIRARKWTSAAAPSDPNAIGGKHSTSFSEPDASPAGLKCSQTLCAKAAHLHSEPGLFSTRTTS